MTSLSFDVVDEASLNRSLSANASAKIPTDGGDDAEDDEDEDEDLEEQGEEVDRGDRGDSVADRMRVCGSRCCHCTDERRKTEGVEMGFTVQW